MTTFNPTLPTAEDFIQLGSVWSREADGREALGKALKTVLGDDLDLAREAANLRRRAQNPQRFWPLLVAMYEPSNPLTHGTLPEGLYGPLISEAANTKLVGAACCDGCRTALQITAQALLDFSSWVAQHVHPSKSLADRAAWYAAEADHLGVLANKLRAEFLQEVTPGIAT